MKGTGTRINGNDGRRNERLGLQDLRLCDMVHIY